MYIVKANILFILKIATDLISKERDFGTRYYKEVFRAFKKFNKTGEHYFYKIYLSDVDLEKFGLEYLFYKGELKETQNEFKIVSSISPKIN